MSINTNLQSKINSYTKGQYVSLSAAKKEDTKDVYSSSEAKENIKQHDLETQAKFAQSFVEKNYPLRRLSQTLYQGIRPVHAQAMKNVFLNQVIEGHHAFCSKAYVYYLCNLYAIHEALERAQQKIINFKGEDFFVLPILYRSEKLLIDIKLWSIFNTTASKFVPIDCHSQEFTSNIAALVMPSTRALIERIEITANQNPLYAIGFLYTFYGTLMSGGQMVKNGVESGFSARLNSFEETAERDEIEVRDKVFKEIESLPNKEEIMKGSSFFNFSMKITDLKEVWHKNIDTLPDKLNFNNDQEQENFNTALLTGARVGVETVLKFIDEIVAVLSKET